MKLGQWSSFPIFHMGKYPVTQREWEAVMGNNPSVYKGANNPVENVSWHDCREYIKKLNEHTGLDFRLPYEAEWEYAAGGGTGSKNQLGRSKRTKSAAGVCLV
ncbi:MAG: formylglycine-generating enzyme family protein [Bacteroidia bacterium]